MADSKKTRRVVICDASPLIFLAKVDQLGLISKVTCCRIVVLSCVVREILSERATPIEAHRLRFWMSNVETVDYEDSLFATDALSRSDQSTLAWAVKNRADCLLADERLLRRFAKEYGIRTIGFCGILIQASQKGYLGQGEAQRCIEIAIQEHGLRISVQLYQKILERLNVD